MDGTSYLRQQPNTASPSGCRRGRWGAESRLAVAGMGGMGVYRLLGRSAVGLLELLSGGWVNHPKVIQE
jgi:hypothetical protein